MSSTKRHPVIGITTEPDDLENRVGVGRNYVYRVMEVGGAPLLMPCGQIAPMLVEDWLDRVDGLLLTGGGDLCMDCYGGKPYSEGSEACVEWVMPERDVMEEPLVKAAWERNIPVLGICRGMQVMNVVRGGTLVRDHSELERADAIQHSHREEINKPFHTVTLDKDSQVARILGTCQMEVNSLHHQAVDELGEGARVVGRAADGVVEAMEWPERDFFLGVQWHPEIIRNTPRLFEALVKAAAEYRDARQA